MDNGIEFVYIPGSVENEVNYAIIRNGTVGLHEHHW